MALVNPYLNFNGNTEEAFNFYKSVFGGEFVALQRFKDVPGAEKFPPAAQEKIMHIALPIGNGNILMATDSIEEMGQKVTPGTNFHLCISTESKEEADRLFRQLSADGNIIMAMENTFWGAYFGMVTDRFGVQWMISYDETYVPQAAAANQKATAEA